LKFVKLLFDQKVYPRELTFFMILSEKNKYVAAIF